jgi:hypothetical protein
MTSDSTVEHLADSFQGLPDAHVIVKHLIPKSVKDVSGRPRNERKAAAHGVLTYHFCF